MACYATDANRVAHAATSGPRAGRPHISKRLCHTRFLSACIRISNLFRRRRHLLSASEHRSTLQDRFATWREVAGLAAA